MAHEIDMQLDRDRQRRRDPLGPRTGEMEDDFEDILAGERNPALLLDEDDIGGVIAPPPPVAPMAAPDAVMDGGGDRFRERDVAGDEMTAESFDDVFDDTAPLVAGAGTSASATGPTRRGWRGTQADGAKHPHEVDRKVKEIMRRRHIYDSPWPSLWHFIVMVLLFLTPVVCYIILGVRSHRAKEKEETSFEILAYSISLMWSISGSLTGVIVGRGTQRRHDVHWGTFKVNALSCILIATAHNFLLFRHYFPFSDTEVFGMVCARFITDYCGSLSSFAGLIDETATLFNSGISKWVAFRNLAWTFVAGLIFFLSLVYIVGLVLFFR